MKKLSLINCMFILITGFSLLSLCALLMELSGCGSDSGGSITIPATTPASTTPVPTLAPTITVSPFPTPTTSPTQAPPVLSSIRDSWEDGKGDNVDLDKNTGIIYFTLTGTNFGNTANSVTFNYSSGGSTSVSPVTTATISQWSDKEIKGSVNLQAGVYLVKVNMGNQATGNNIYYYKGNGTYKEVIQTRTGNTGSSLSEKLIPLGSSFIRVTIEHTSGVTVSSEFKTLTNSTEVTLENVPLGINTATVEIWDGTKANIKAIRKYSFFLSSGETVNPGDLDMGMGIDQNGNMIPYQFEFYLTSGTMHVYIENHDDVPHSLKIDTIPSQTININAVVPYILPITSTLFDGKFFSFNTHGTFNVYIDGSTKPNGQIIVLKPGGTGNELPPL